MEDLKAKIAESVEFINRKSKIKPKIAIILGTGLGRLAEDIEEKELTKEEFVKLYKEERKKSSGIKQTFSNLFKSGRGVFNPFRLIAYALLCISMLVLVRNELFSAIPFLVGIGAVPISSLVLGFVLRK